MIKVKVKSNQCYQGKWYFKGEEAVIEQSTFDAVGADNFVILEETKQEPTVKTKEKIANKKLKDIEAK